MIRVLIVDDQELVRAGLRGLLGNDPGIEIAGEASGGVRALAEARRLRPDVVLMDLRMPGGAGLDATAAITAELPGTRVLVLTTFDEPGEIDAAVRAGAAGYLLKDTGADELRRAVHTVAAGGSLLSPTVARHLMDRLAAQDPPPSPDPRLTTLTERELQVLARVGLGETNQEIAAALFLSPATARTYVSRLLAKLRARDRTQLAVIAHRSGLTPPR
ncbi:DNA-binding NarL/FixJ family response regulator [Catenuloplanes nepalensis]|uniref:DNA-binding NarL/FixJ family response regulator n=1 Tax=Catenuloplanes nepalensis TaxID=587533 RepID=A0ABT9MZJ6_9ACTN|nr:response regulator transcription factor [Catenuloplanes nepalensis]MDP9796785.1 DNA-binding NarL/FixJ family response regulator [Catenuloplanes nepalensis]